MRTYFLSVIVAIVSSVCVVDDVILPWYFSFMEVMCDLSANIARVFKSIRHSDSPVGTGGGCGMVTSKSCSFAMDWLVCFASGDSISRRIIISAAGRLVGASGISPVGSMMVSYAVFVRLASVSSGCSVIASVFVMASCSAKWNLPVGYPYFLRSYGTAPDVCRISTYVAMSLDV